MAAPKKKKIDERLAAALEALRVALGVRDVLTDGKSRIWVMGGPKTLRRSLGPRGRIYYWLTASAPKGDQWTIRSYLENADHWSGWQDAITFGLQELGLGSDWEVTPVPATTLPHRAWSARKKRWLEAGPKPHFRFCEQPPVRVGSADGPVLISVDGKLPPLMLTHGVSYAKMAEVRKCGGFLWPSFALSWRIPPTYGDFVFFASTTVIADLLKPTGGKDRSMYLAGTDIWSPDARVLTRMEKAIEHELAGDAKWWAGDREQDEGGWGRRDLQQDLVIEGVTAEDLVGRMSYFEDWTITEPLKHRRELVRRMRFLFDTYADPKDPYAYPERDPELRITSAPYPYGELKVLGKVELSNMPLVVYPSRLKKTADKWLDELGFVGFRYAIPYKGPLHKDADEAQRRAFARQVTLAVLHWAQAPCHTKGVSVPEHLMLDSFRSTYPSELLWITAGSLNYANTRKHGYCGRHDPGPAEIRLSAPVRDWVEDVQSGRRVGLELASAVAEVDDPEMVKWYRGAERGRISLTKADADVANAYQWFPVPVVPGAEVVVVDLSHPVS